MISVCFYLMKIYTHRKLEAELLPLDIELKRTLRNLRKVKGAKEEIMANQRERMQPIP